jgi:hypothetical protein
VINEILVTWLNKRAQVDFQPDLVVEDCPPAAFDRRYRPIGREYGEFLTLDAKLCRLLATDPSQRDLMLKRLIGGLQHLIRSERRVVVFRHSFQIIVNDLDFPEWQGTTIAWHCQARIVKKTWLRAMGLRESPEEEFERVTGSKYIP